MESTRTVGNEFRWAMAAGALALALATLRWPYGYYEFLRLAVTALAIWLAIAGHRKGSIFWTILGAGVALLFNPIAPVHLNRETWLPIDLAVAAAFILAAFNVPEKRS